MASHLGLRSLTMSHLWDARLRWVNIRFFEKAEKGGEVLLEQGHLFGLILYSVYKYDKPAFSHVTTCTFTLF